MVISALLVVFISKSNYYIFIPQKVQVTKKDFNSINEGDKVIKNKGENLLHILKASSIKHESKQDFLDLLE